ncbi:MAG TPA: chemotaxis protein [Candidatus Eisenbacteria bacterium]|nr:chemotaxis protein [Candidatus Eisenbacteria bacterium]
MAHPIAVAFIHGIGRTEPGYSVPMQRSIQSAFEERTADAVAPALVFEEINWSAALQNREDLLYERLEEAGKLGWARLRHFMVDFAADAIAYQPAPSDRSAYDAVHLEVACSLKRLAERAGPRAPLCIIAHSLGTVIASNYVYDLAKKRKSFACAEVRSAVGRTPIERGETLALLYTLGSPIALWSLRYPKFGQPIAFPPRRLVRHHPDLAARWINVYDPDDVIGYPLRELNSGYRRAVTEDRPVSAGSLWTGWTPLSHVGYWSNDRLAVSIATDLAVSYLRASAVAPPHERPAPLLRQA